MESIKVKDYMVYQPTTFKADMALSEAVSLLHKEKQIGAPVVDKDCKLVGFISEQECLSYILKGAYHCDLMIKVSECMRLDVLSVKENDSILDIAELMTQDKPKILPVMDQDGYLLGIITRKEILAALCKHLNLMEKSQL